MNDNEKKSLVCFAGCDWWYHNRGLFSPQIMSRLSKERKVLFINSLGMRVPSLKNDSNAISKVFRKLRSFARFLKKDDCGMYVLSPLSIPCQSNFGRFVNAFFLKLQIKTIMAFLGIRKPVAYIGCLPALEVVKKMAYSYLIYERTDIFTEMPGIDKDYIIQLDNKLIEMSDLVLYVNRAMLREGIKANKNSILIGHGVDYDYFKDAEKSPLIPDDIAEISKPIVGFFGDISDDVCDLSLIRNTAESLPEVSFVFVGPISSDITELKKLDNIYFLGPKPYEQVAHYGKVFDVAFMPWKQNKWIEFCNPVKTKEYLALGNPIVTIYYPEIEPYEELVYVAKKQEEFVDAIQKALAEKDEVKKEQRRLSVRDETWKNKVSIIQNYIGKG